MNDNVIAFKPREPEQQTAPDFENVPLETALCAAGFVECRAAEIAKYFRRTLARLGFNEAEALKLLKIIAHCVSYPPTDAQVKVWGAKTRDWLNAIYGADTPAMLKAAQSIASGDRLFNALLVLSATGDHPEVVQIFIDVGLRQGALDV